MPSCGVCALEESRGQRAAADVCRAEGDMPDLVAVADERYDPAWPTAGPPRFPRVRNPYLRAALSRLYLNGRLAFLCGIVAPLALVVSVWSLLHGDFQLVLGTIALLSALGVTCAVLVLRWDVAAIRADQATEGPSPH